MKKAPFWVFAFAFFPLGLGGIVLSVGDAVHGYRSLRWPAIPAVVLSSNLSPRFLTADQPEIRYSYNYEERPYVSNRIWPGDVIASLPVVRGAASRDFLRRFPKDKNVSVFVNPKDSTDVALIPGPKKVFCWAAVFVLFLLVGFWAPFRYRSSRHEM